MSGKSARTIRNFLDIRKSTFQHLTVHWNLNVLEMALKTLHLVQGLPMTPFFLFSSIFQNQISQAYLFFKIDKSGNLRVWKRRAPKNDRDLSNQKCFNFRGVLIGDKTNCKTDTWELEISLGNFRLGTLAPGSQAGGTWLLWLGELVGAMSTHDAS